MKMFDRKRLMVRSAAVVLVALQQGIASYGYAHEGATEYLPEIRAELLEAVRQPELSDQMHQQAETTIAALQADNNVKLERRVRQSTREALADAVPTDEAAPEVLVQNQGFHVPSADTNLSEPSG
jgi:hypothetical protein